MNDDYLYTMNKKACHFLPATFPEPDRQAELPAKNSVTPLAETGRSIPKNH
jgi:hypothetical protein